MRRDGWGWRRGERDGHSRLRASWKDMFAEDGADWAASALFGNVGRLEESRDRIDCHLRARFWKSEMCRYERRIIMMPAVVPAAYLLVAFQKMPRPGDSLRMQESSRQAVSTPNSSMRHKAEQKCGQLQAAKKGIHRCCPDVVRESVKYNASRLCLEPIERRSYLSLVIYFYQLYTLAIYSSLTRVLNENHTASLLSYSRPLDEDGAVDQTVQMSLHESRQLRFLYWRTYNNDNLRIGIPALSNRCQVLFAQKSSTYANLWNL